jgi:hypothetical protein
MKKKKPKPFRATKAVKAAARNLLGSPRPSQIEPAIPKRGTEARKHKKPLARLLEEE